jgi:hypothetical protein
LIAHYKSAWASQLLVLKIKTVILSHALAASMASGIVANSLAMIFARK